MKVEPTHNQDAREWKATLALVLTGLALYGASFNDPFHFDDSLILNDSNVTNAGRWMHFFNPLHLRQLTFFTFYLNHLFFGIGADSFHVVNVLLHIANAVLLFRLVRRFAEYWIAAGAAALFLVHPIQTEAVLYVYQRSVLLACFFSLLGALALAERRPWLGFLCLLLAFEGKESALAAPAVLALLWKPEGEVGRRLRLSLLAAGVIMAAAGLALLAYWEERTVGLYAENALGPLGYLQAQSRVFYTYVRLLLFPFPQSLEYEFAGPYGIAPAVGVILIAAVAVWLTRLEQWRPLGAGVIAFLVLLAPTSTIVPSVDLAFEHRLYLPMLAFSVIAAWLIAKVPGRMWIGSAILVLLSVATIRRGAAWSTDTALWEDTVRKAPGKARAWFNLGGAYLNVDPEKAKQALLRALELDPGRVEALYNLGLIEQREGKYNAALTYYMRAGSRDPEYWPAWNNIGNTLFAMGRQDEAIDYFERTLSLNKDYWPAYYNAAVVHFLRGRYDQAAARLRTVLDWNPEFRQARYLFSVALARSGDPESADAEMKKLGPIAPSEFQSAPPILEMKQRSSP